MSNNKKKNLYLLNIFYLGVYEVYNLCIFELEDIDNKKNINISVFFFSYLIIGGLMYWLC